MAGISRTITDHDEIRRWAEWRGDRPARVKGTDGVEGADILQIRSHVVGEDHDLEDIDSAASVEKFEESRLLFRYPDEAREVETSYFLKLVRD